TAKQRKTERAEKSFPRFFRADLRNHEMPANRAAGQVCPHVAEFCDRNQIQDIELSCEHATARARRKIDDLRDEIKKPKHVEQTEQGVSHRLQRFVMAQAREHLSRENRQQKKEQHGNFEVVGTRRPNLAEVIKTAVEHDCAPDHAFDLEIRKMMLNENAIK